MLKEWEEAFFKDQELLQKDQQVQELPYNLHQTRTMISLLAFWVLDYLGKVILIEFYNKF